MSARGELHGPSPENPLEVLAVGACAPSGLSARTVQCEVDCGTPRFSLSSVVDFAGDPVRAALLSVLPESAERTDRLAALAATALADCLRQAARVADLPPRIRTIVAMPPTAGGPARSTPGPDANPGSAYDPAVVLEALRGAAGGAELSFERGNLEAGRAGWFQALTAAWGVLGSGRAGFALVGGVDSRCDLQSLTLAVESNRVAGARNPDGLLPGEGAAFALVALPRSRTGSVPPGAPARPPRIVSLATAQEPRPFAAYRGVTGDGLTAAFRAISRTVKPSPGRGARMDYLLSAQTGESFWDRELSYAYLRNPELMPHPFRVHLAAKAHGDAGVAAGALQLVQALYLCERHGSDDGPPAAKNGPPAAARALLYGCDDGGTVGACVLEAAPDAARGCVDVEQNPRPGARKVSIR